MTGYLEARREADAKGLLTFGELSKKYGYNVIALASRVSLGWTEEEIKTSKRDGLEFSRRATFDFTGKQHSTAGLFCAKYNINLKVLTDITEHLKTAEEFSYVVNALSSGHSLQSLTQEYKGRVSLSEQSSEVVKPNDNNNNKTLSAPMTEISEPIELNVEAIVDDNQKVEQPKKEDKQSEEMEDQPNKEVECTDVASEHTEVSSSLEQETLQKEVSCEAKAAEIRTMLLKTCSNVKLCTPEGKIYDTLEDFLVEQGIDDIDVGELKHRLALGFSFKDIISDLSGNTYLASEFDTGEFDFKDGVDGMSFVDYCKKHGVSTQYVLTKYRRSEAQGITSVNAIVSDFKSRGNFEDCLYWFLCKKGY